MSHATKLASAAAVLFLLVMVVRAQPKPDEVPAKPLNRTITANGSATIRTKPDSVRVFLGVVTQSESVATAREENAAVIAKIQKAIQALGLRDLNAKTRDSSTRIIRNMKTQTAIAAYEVSQSFSVVFHSDDPDELATAAAKLLDAGLQNGANDQGEVQFFLADDSLLKREARTKAVEDALKNAAALAAGAETRILEVVEIHDSTWSNSRFAASGGNQGGFSDAEEPAGLIAGDWQVEASVTIVCRH